IFFREYRSGGLLQFRDLQQVLLLGNDDTVWLRHVQPGKMKNRRVNNAPQAVRVFATASRSAGDRAGDRAGGEPVSLRTTPTPCPTECPRYNPACRGMIRTPPQTPVRPSTRSVQRRR